MTTKEILEEIAKTTEAIYEERGFLGAYGGSEMSFSIYKGDVRVSEREFHRADYKGTPSDMAADFEKTRIRLLMTLGCHGFKKIEKDLQEGHFAQGGQRAFDPVRMDKLERMQQELLNHNHGKKSKEPALEAALTVARGSSSYGQPYLSGGMTKATAGMIINDAREFEKYLTGSDSVGKVVYPTAADLLGKIPAPGETKSI